MYFEQLLFALLKIIDTMNGFPKVIGTEEIIDVKENPQSECVQKPVPLL